VLEGREKARRYSNENQNKLKRDDLTTRPPFPPLSSPPFSPLRSPPNDDLHPSYFISNSLGLLPDPFSLDSMLSLPTLDFPQVPRTALPTWPEIEDESEEVG